MTTRVVQTEDVHDIVSIIIRDTTLVQNKLRFYGSLGLPPAGLLDLQNAAKSFGADSYSFFSACLHSWISREGREANYGVLASILRKEGFTSVADEISGMDFNVRPTEPINPRNSSSVESNDVSATVANRIGDHRAVIDDNIVSLCDFTNCTPRLLDKLMQNKIITRDESIEVKRQPHGYEKNSALYEVLRRKDGEAFVKLVIIMEAEETKQSKEVLSILKTVVFRS